MSDIILTQTELERKIKALRFHRTEMSNIDAKVVLNLGGDGDKAELIRDIVAFANTGQNSYLIIGLANKTWVAEGIPDGSSLLDVDKTQHDINQHLSTKLDPSLSINYRTYPFEKVTIGVIGIKGDRYPYVISIKDNASFGGSKTDGKKQKYIYEGQIFIRREDETKVASRQSDILDVVEKRMNITGIVTTLGLVTALIGVALGLGTSIYRSSEPYSAVFLGSIVGFIIGGIFHERLSKNFGNFPTGPWIKLKSIVGFLWGALVGGTTNYSIMAYFLNGGKVYNPLEMSLFTGVFLAPAIGVLIVVYPYGVINFFKFIIRITNLPKSKLS